MASEVPKKRTILIFTLELADFQNLKKSNLKRRENKMMYTKFSIDTKTPKIPGASKNKGRNQKEHTFSKML